MGIYRRIEIHFWADGKVKNLSPIPPCGQGLWLYLLTGPHTGIIPGLFKSGHAAMAEELGWPIEAFEEAFGEALREGLVKDSPKDLLMWIPKAIKYNPPASPNVVRSWAAALDFLPECPLLFEAIECLRESVYLLDKKEVKGFSKGFGKAFREAFGEGIGEGFAKGNANPSPNQEQEQEQDIKRRIHTPRARENPERPEEQQPPITPLEEGFPKAVYAAWLALGEKVYQQGDFATVFASRWGELRRSLQGIHSNDVLAAIANLGKILNGPSGRYYWNQRVTLKNFFEKHLEKFLPQNFREEDFLSRGDKPMADVSYEARARAEEAKRVLGFETTT